MPDNSEGSVYQTGLRGGRKPSALPPRVPYRIEEWGKSRSYLLSADASVRLKSLKFPISVEEYERAIGPMISKRGPPTCGTLAVYIGEETRHPPRDPMEGGVPVRVVEEGFAHTKKEARDRLDAYIRRRQLEQRGKQRGRDGIVLVGSGPPVP